MKAIKKLTSLLVLCLSLGFGITQLTTEAYAGTCPQTHCSNAFTCLMYVDPIGTCYQNGQLNYVYQTAFCLIESCYAPEDYSSP